MKAGSEFKVQVLWGKKNVWFAAQCQTFPSIGLPSSLSTRNTSCCSSNVGSLKVKTALPFGQPAQIHLPTERHIQTTSMLEHSAVKLFNAAASKLLTNTSSACGLRFFHLAWSAGSPAE